MHCMFSVVRGHELCYEHLGEHCPIKRSIGERD